MKQKYEHIQLLRALACIGVFITHLAPRLGATGKAAWLANQGAAGVYLFFVLSGYLACCDRKLPTAGKKELLTYYKKRLVRILPLYYGVILYNILLHGLILKDIPADPQGLYWLRYFFLTNSVIPCAECFLGKPERNLDDQPVYGVLSACAGLCAPDPRLYERVFLLCTGIDSAVFVGKNRIR